MQPLIIFKPEITAEELGFDAATHPGVVGLSKRSYWQGYSSFLLGKSVASGRDIFNRSAFVFGWKSAAINSMRTV
jgi:hypothetical protein